MNEKIFIGYTPYVAYQREITDQIIEFIPVKYEAVVLPREAFDDSIFMKFFSENEIISVDNYV